MKSKLLYFSKEIENEIYVSIISKCLYPYTLIIIDNYQQFNQYINHSDIDIYIIDFSSNEGLKVLSYLNKYFPQKKVITICDKLQYSINHGCDYCIKNYNRRRLFKPFNFLDLLDLVKNFDTLECALANKFDNIYEVLDKVLSRFSCFSYKKEYRKIDAMSNCNNTLLIKELVEITELLETSNIKYNVEEDYSIVIL